jgi:hypothetical protein
VKQLSFCPKCGTKTVEGAHFCENCGSPIEGALTAVSSNEPAKALMSVPLGWIDNETRNVANTLQRTILLKPNERFVDISSQQGGIFFLLLNAERVSESTRRLMSLTYGYRARYPISFRTSDIRTGRELVGALAFTTKRLIFLERRDQSYIVRYDLPFSQIEGVTDATTSRMSDPMLRKRPYFVVTCRTTEYRFYHPEASAVADALRNYIEKTPSGS